MLEYCATNTLSVGYVAQTSSAVADGSGITLATGAAENPYCSALNLFCRLRADFLRGDDVTVWRAAAELASYGEFGSVSLGASLRHADVGDWGVGPHLGLGLRLPHERVMLYLDACGYLYFGSTADDFDVSVDGTLAAGVVILWPRGGIGHRAPPDREAPLSDPDDMMKALEGATSPWGED